MKLLITGVTGLIGGQLAKECEQNGIAINYLTTHKNKIENSPQYKGFYWNPETGEIDKECIEGVDKIIHLAGASVAKRWTQKRRKEILASRIKSADLLRSLIKESDNTVTQFISASAIGIYPDSMSKLYDEDSTEKSNDFLGLVVQEWETAADEFKELGIEVTKIRIGLVLAANGGFLKEIKKPVQYYAGSCLGSGNQWQSWIHIEDLARIFLFVAENELTGVFNAVSPNPVKQKFLIKCIADQLDKKIILPAVPKLVLRATLGEMSSMITSSQLVMSKRLRSHNFHFHFPHLKAAVRDILHA